MDRLKLLALCVLSTAVFTSQPSAAASDASPASSRIDQWQEPIASAAQRFGIPDAWIRNVMQSESGGRTHLGGKPITSANGAMGLMQIMPETYRSLRAQYRLGANAYDPRDNIFAGAAYLRQMYDRYGYPSLFAAYNAGPKRLEGFLARGAPLPTETRRYMSAVAPGADIGRAFPENSVPGAPPLLSTEAVLPRPTSPDSLFFDRKDVVARPNPQVQSASSDANSHDPQPGFAATNSSALFVPLSATAH